MDNFKMKKINSPPKLINLIDFQISQQVEQDFIVYIVNKIEHKIELNITNIIIKLVKILLKMKIKVTFFLPRIFYEIFKVLENQNISNKTLDKNKPKNAQP